MDGFEEGCGEDGGAGVTEGLNFPSGINADKQIFLINENNEKCFGKPPYCPMQQHYCKFKTNAVISQARQFFSSSYKILHSVSHKLSKTATIFGF